MLCNILDIRISRFLNKIICLDDDTVCQEVEGVLQVFVHELVNRVLLHNHRQGCADPLAVVVQVFLSLAVVFLMQTVD